MRQTKKVGCTVPGQDVVERREEKKKRRRDEFCEVKSRLVAGLSGLDWMKAGTLG